MNASDLVLLIAGLSVIGLGLILSQRLGNMPVQFGFDKLGLDLKADRLTFVLIVGLMLIGVGVFFRYRNYENDVASLNQKVANFDAEQKQQERSLELFRKELQAFKVYDLRLRVDVPRGFSEKDFELSVWSKKPGDPAPELRDYKARPGFGYWYFELSNLDQGEKITVAAKNVHDESWWKSSSDIEIPETQIGMEPDPNGGMQ